MHPAQLTMNLRDRIVFVTGGASGIGRALGDEAARRGAHVVLADLRSESAEAAARGIEGKGGSAEAVQLDVADADAFRRCVDRVVERHGRIDYLFNNAGVGITAEGRDTDMDAWRRIVDVNLMGVVHGVQAAYPHMIRQRSGHIANTACVAGLVPFPMTSAYSATKHAVVGLSASLRPEAAAHGVKVSVICPGTVATEMFEHIEYIGVDKQAVLSSIRRATITPRRCATAILAGVARNKPVITVSAHAKLAWWLYRFAPRTFLAITGRAFHLFRDRLRSPAPETPKDP
ncbi:MAG: SDR family oxidoreductase [Acidobacteriota bacterium]